MGKLIYSMITSLDGCVSDPDGKFGWGAPDDEAVHAFINDFARSIGTYLYGRRMYETMVYWETADAVPDRPPVILNFARSGRRPTRSSTPPRSTSPPARGRGSSGRSTRRRSGG